MEYRSFDALQCGFPRPHVPVLPPPQWRDLRIRRQFRPNGHPEGGSWQFLARGRYALTQAYRSAGLAPDTTVLLPSYHCRTMLDPAISLGGQIALYPLNSDLTVDLAGLQRCLDGAGAPAVALLVCHFFGYPQSLDALLAWCRKNRIHLIEDCSHCLVADGESGLVGRTGDYGVASPYKFFPSEDGGLFWSNTGICGGPVREPSMRQQLRSAARLFAGIAPGINTAHSARSLKVAVTLPDIRIPDRPDRTAVSSRLSDHYAPAMEGLAALATSRWIVDQTDRASLSRRRVAHYRQWAARVAILPHCKALFPDLPPSAIPYMFPLLINHPDPHFYLLKHLGVPIWRWDDMAVSGCGNAAAYRTQLLHLPCHQGLSRQQMDWMMDTMALVLRSPPSHSLFKP